MSAYTIDKIARRVDEAFDDWANGMPSPTSADLVTYSIPIIEHFWAVTGHYGDGPGGKRVVYMRTADETSRDLWEAMCSGEVDGSMQIAEFIWRRLAK